MKDKFACRSLAFVFLLSLPVSFNACGGGGGESDASEVLSELCVDGNSCDDGDPCTHSDQCNNGVCSGVVYDCIALPCAAPPCDGNGGCVYKPYAGWCLIDSVCVEESSLNSKNQCEGCDPAKDNLVWTKLSSVSCNDGDVCTVKDTCVEGVCLGEAKDCGDDNDCTDDNCEAGIGCVHEYLQGA
ncbi:MAG: hypothetical protein FJ088_05215, partial [Deltaproteobacteria bacterium]|nr:hypothetical protein [Deltaproteobacteria bacterium]